MRPLPSPPTAVAKNQSLSYPTAAAATSTSTCGPDHDTCKWKPYSNSSDDFEANAVLILIVLFCALTCALALKTAIRCFLRDNNSYDQQQPTPSAQIQHHRQRNNNKPSAEVAAPPTLVVHSAGMKLTGAEAECVICLSEFVEGDVIQVLERCKHGFHLQCIQKWLYSHNSCPICRCNCLFSPTSTPTHPHQPH